MKSACQLRFEARKAHLDSSEFDAMDQLRAMGERISRAREKRKQQVSSRRLSARDRVLKAHAVARAASAEEASRSQDHLMRLQMRLEEAEKRRQEKLAQTAWQCQQRHDRITSTLQALVDNTIEKRRVYDASLHAARHRRAALTSAYVSKLSQHVSHVELTKDRIQTVRADAAKVLQGWFRGRCRLRQCYAAAAPLRPAMTTILDLWARVGATSFEESMGLVQDRAVAAKAHAAAKVLFEGASYRVLLMAGMLTHHPRETMDDISVDMRLHFCARQVCRALATLTTATSSVALFTPAWRRWDACRLAYVAMFTQWKERDGDRLTSDMLNVYAELFAVHTTATLEHATDIVATTAGQLAQLRGAIEQTLGGEATAVRLQAMEDQIAARLAPPRPASPPPSQPSSISPPTPPKPDLEVAKTVFANDELAHEVILNPAFQLSEADQLPVTAASRIHTTMQNAFWDRMRASLDRQWVVGTLVELRDAIASVCKQPTLTAAVPSDRLMAMAQSGAWDEWTEVVLASWLQVVADAEAPARRDTTMAYRAQLLASAPPASEAEWFDRLCAFIRFGFDKLEMLRLDSMNTHLRMLSPYLARHGVDHEAKKFSQRVERGDVTLARTQAWLARHVAAASADERVAMRAGQDAAVRKVLRRAFVALVHDYIADASLPWPETFEMDRARVRGWRNRLDSVVLQASLVALVRDVVGPAYSAAQATAFRRQLAILMAEESIKMADLVAQVMHEAAHEWPSADARAAFERRVEQIAQPTNPVFGLFSRRVTDVVQNVVVDGAPLNVPPSLEAFEGDLATLCAEMTKLAQHNEAVHAPYYNRLVREALT
ncbi:Aste57867_21181 [Aphanomyces stellatus]|uniref:Aste57867_21181 protein n=1 Tax=Aphanomyces stellatus TaxID=120398 RepID=A0A485LGX5_9STRA|nr:hypothetical protein As57867_021113 [Aphanomyces stellatus]VFT97855.1 Aste57867_21181 [Aphanomyces stellatus]